MLPDVRKRRIHRHRHGARNRGLRTHSQNRAVAIATGCADPVEFRHARGREPGGAAGDLWRTAPARTDVTAPGIATASIMLTPVAFESHFASRRFPDCE